jgi:hypothetical protein
VPILNKSALEGWLTAWLDGVDLWATGPKAKRAD